MRDATVFAPASPTGSGATLTPPSSSRRSSRRRTPPRTRPASSSATICAVVDDQHAIRQRADLLQLERDEQDAVALRRAARSGGGGRTRSRRRRGRASAARRSAPAGPRRSRARSRPSAGCRPRARSASASGSPPRTSYSSSSGARALAHPLRREQAEPVGRSARGGSRAAHRFSARLKSSTSPRRWRSSAMWPTPGVELPRTPRPVTSRPSTRTVPASGCAARSASRSARSGRCRRRRRARRSRPPRTSKVDAVDGGQAAVVARPRGPATSSSGVARLGRLLVDPEEHVAPDHQRARLASVAPSVDTVSIFLPRRSTVTRSAMSSTSRELVRDEDDRLAPSAVSVRRIRNSSAVSCAVSTAVGSSRISTSAPRSSARRISTRCWVPTEMSADARVGVDGEPEALGELAHAPCRRLACRSSSALARLGRRGRCSPPPSSPGRA